MVPKVDQGGLAVALRHVGSYVVFGVLPAVLLLVVLGSTVGKQTGFYDFHGDLYNAGRAILHGRNPYRPELLDHLAALARNGKPTSTTFAVPVYPAPDLLAATPLALLPFRLAGSLFTALGFVAMVIGLWLLGARDWRCYGIAFVSWPLLHSLRLGQVNELLVLGIGTTWRWRQQLYAPAVAVASVVAAKVVLWPLYVFLLITRRARVAILSVLLTALGVLAAWAAIGFASLTDYPRMLGDLSAIEGGAGVSFVSLGRAIGVSRTVSEIVAFAITVGVLCMAWSIMRRHGSERRAFGLTVMAGLISSPLVWPHYLTLAFVPIALLSPRLSWLWLVPLIAYLAPAELTNGDVWKMLPYLAIEVITIAALIFWPDAETSASPSSVASELAAALPPGPVLAQAPRRSA
jgi:hypothetical protein